MHKHYKIPAEIQGRVYSAWNTLRFFTIPVEYFLGSVFEPFMEQITVGKSYRCALGSGKGLGAAALFFAVGIWGVAVCLIFRRNRHIKNPEQ